MGDPKKNSAKHRESQHNESPENPSKPSDTTKEASWWLKKRTGVVMVSFIVLLISAFWGVKENSIELQKALDFDFDFDFSDLKGNLPTTLISALNEAKGESTKHQVDTTNDFVVGKYMVKENYTSNNPVVMVPGVISTGLESWGLSGTPECPSEPHFRKRLWGSFYMLKAMFLNKNCWLQHIMLDPETGLDPPNFKIRAAQGFEAADFFITGYWIWNKIVSNLAVLGYGPNEMTLAAYDWRLTYLDLEKRDQYFTKLKDSIEVQYAQNGKKIILVGHSMGSQVIYFFLKWVEAYGKNFGNGGPDWVNTYLDGVVDISGSTLGTPKAVTALLSGEMKDTVQLNSVAVYGLEKFFSRKERVDMLRTFGGIPSMIPKGGDRIWGDLTSSPDDSWVNKTTETSYGSFIKFKEHIGKFSAKNLTLQDTIQFLLDNSPSWFKNRVMSSYSYGITSDPVQLMKNNQDSSKWTNPLECPLPNAPNLTYYCFYGIGNPTERSYTYQEEKEKLISKLNVSMAYGEKDSVTLSDGDGTVSLITHTMCHKWREENSVYNPGNVKVKIVEMKHEPERFDIRGGSKTSEHVDILGSTELNELILKVVSGRGHEIEDRIISQLPEFIKKMGWEDEQSKEVSYK
ncbi:phospholipid:diacylglycerol acyltransferase [Saccharomycopsis crataegensis]|uniref:Phospholipid:diacylglycerol acyltransferase n=1 Tax=Saccharomycopsis crataegensis TaxID=43959 RepID=A0AAV5QJ39_9ASCO|nr:phospholipid:diacylglycerol acyltransferase [Saccharomycopsis crataegensis]